MKNIPVLLFSAFIAVSCKVPRTSFLKTIGGRDATAPAWYASLVVTKGGRDEVICGGSLIGEKTVLTAAHCVRDLGNPISITLGKSDRTEIKEQDKMAVKAIYIHEDYKSFNEGSDLALIYLEKASSTSPIDILSEDSGTEFKIFGFGKSSNFASLSFNKIQTLDIKKLASSQCGQSYGDISKALTEGSYSCFTGKEDGQNICKGDSGSAVVVKKDGKDYIHSISSFGGVVCTLKELPSVFTNSFYFKDWINKHNTYKKFEDSQNNDWSGYYKKIRSLCYYGRSYSPSDSQSDEQYWNQVYDINLPQSWDPINSVNNYQANSNWSLCEEASSAAMTVTYGSEGAKPLFEVTSSSLGTSKKYIEAVVSEKTSISCKLGEELVEIEVNSEAGNLNYAGLSLAMRNTASQCSGSSISCKVGSKEVKLYGNSSYLSCVTLIDSGTKNYTLELNYYGVSAEISHNKEGDIYKGEIKVRNDWKAPIRAWQLDCDIDGATYKLKEDSSAVNVTDSKVLDFSRYEYKGFDFPKASSKVISFETSEDISASLAKRTKCVFNGLKIPTTYRSSDKEAADIYFGSRCCSSN